MAIIKKMRSRNFVAAAVVTSFAGSALLGPIAGACDGRESAQYYNGSNAALINDKQMQADEELRLQAHAVLREHAALAVPALKAELLQEPDAEAILAAVEENNLAVAGTVEQIYPGTHDEFLDLWRKHIAYYIEYLQAAEAQDEAGKQAAREKLVAFVGDATYLLGSHSENLDQEALAEGLSMHGEQTLSIIDNLVAENYPEVYSLAHEAYEHIGGVADILVEGRSENNSHHTPAYES